MTFNLPLSFYLSVLLIGFLVGAILTAMRAGAPSVKDAINYLLRRWFR